MSTTRYPAHPRLTELLGPGRKAGQPIHAEELLPLVYQDLRNLARRQLGQRNGTLQATSLVHEAWLRVVGDQDPGWDCRAHFFGAAARAMRRILVEDARRKGRLRYGGALARSELDPAQPAILCEVPPEDLLSLDAALEQLAQRSAQQAEIVTLRFFSGLTMEDIATLMGIPPKRVQREWNFARAWLEVQMRKGEEPS